MGAAKWLSKWLHVEHGTLSIYEARALAPTLGLTFSGPLDNTLVDYHHI